VWQTAGGVSGRAVQVNSLGEFLKHSRRADFVIINCDVTLAMKLAGLYMLLPWLRRPVLAHDVVLRKPQTLRSRMLAPVKRFLLGRIDHFTLYFRDLAGYSRYFGIGPDRVSYVAGKVNLRYRYEYKVGAEGGYVLCFGRSERDYDTFFEAMELVPDIPAAIPPPRFDAFRQHASRFTRGLAELPGNVRIVDDDGSPQSLIRVIEGARLVVLPTVAARIAPSGIGTYLNAMIMGKCVILSEGVSTSDVLLDGEALLVPPEDPKALAAMIRRAWQDDGLRETTAGKGRRYAESCGGEPELRQRVLEAAVAHLPLIRH
jgi:glycosyltransferase involved in cell wall biosynthesis